MKFGIICSVLSVFLFMNSIAFGQLSCSDSSSCTGENDNVCNGGSPCSPKVLDILIVYTTAAKNDPLWGNGGNQLTEEKIQLLVDTFNVISAQSGVIHRMRLVHTEEIGYLESSDPLSGIAEDINRLANPTTQYPELVRTHELRDIYGADLVSLIVSNTTGQLGTGNLSGCESGFNPARGFTVINIPGVLDGVYSFHHEIGHNLGLYHNELAVCNCCGQSGEGPNYMYCGFMKGYVSPNGLDTNNNTTSNTRFRTIMAYTNEVAPNDGNCQTGDCIICPVSCNRIPYWSNPDSTYLNTGIEYGDATSNSVKGINITACYVSEYREDGRSSDSIALVNFYNSTGGQTWTIQWDFAEPIDKWNGILLNDVGRVVNIDLHTNNLTGELPNIQLPFVEWVNFNDNNLYGNIPVFSHLYSLEIFSANGNELTGNLPVLPVSTRLIELNVDNNNLKGLIPDFGVYPDLELLYLKGNRFTFSDFLPNYHANENATDLFSYYPQQQVGEELFVEAAINGNYTLCLSIDDTITTSTYEWFKDSIAFDTTIVNEITLENLDVSNEGVYYCQITNPNASDLTLSSKNITIDVVSEAAPPIVWEQNYGEYYPERAYDICISNDSTSYLVCGYCSTPDYKNLCIKKLDQAGGVIWENEFGGTGNEVAYSITQSINGQGYICIGNSTSNDGDVSDNYGLSDLWVIVIDENGNLIWEQNYGGSQYESAKSIIQSNSKDGYIILGETVSNDGDINGYHDKRDYWVLRIDTIGTKIWSKAFGGSDHDYPEDLVPAVEEDGYVIVGWTKSDDGDLPYISGNTSDAWYFKLSENGSILWQQSYNHPGSQLLAQAITPNLANDGYVIAAKAYGPYVNISSNSSIVHAAFATTSTGEVNWIRYQPAHNYITINDICKANEGNGYLMCGYHGGFAEVLKVDSIGNFFWVANSGGVGGGTESFSIIPTIPRDGYLVGGSTNAESLTNGTYDWWLFQIDGTLPLPVELEHFIGYEKDDKNRLEWQTQSEENIVQFSVERSIDGIEWKEIGIVNAKGNSMNSVEYKFDDNAPLEKAYYRLRIINYDDQKEFSPVIYIERNIDAVFSINHLFPNPTNGDLIVELSSTKQIVLQYYITDISGVTILSGNTELTRSRQDLNLSLVSIPSGVYLLTCNTGREVAQMRFVKH